MQQQTSSATAADAAARLSLATAAVAVVPNPRPVQSPHLSPSSLHKSLNATACVHVESIGSGAVDDLSVTGCRGHYVYTEGVTVVWNSHCAEHHLPADDKHVVYGSTTFGGVDEQNNAVKVYVIVPVVCSAAAVFFSVIIILLVLGRRRRNRRKQYRGENANEPRISVHHLDVKDLELAEMTAVCVMGRDYRTLSTVTTDEYSYVMHVRDASDHHSLRMSSLSLSDKTATNEAPSGGISRSLKSGSETSLSVVEDSYINSSFQLPGVDDVFRAVFPYSGQPREADLHGGEYDNGQLTFEIGDVISKVTDATTDGWWRGMCNGRIGWFPGSYVESCVTVKTPQSVRFSDSSECIEHDDQEKNFYETIEDVTLRVDKDSALKADDKEEETDEAFISNITTTSSVPEYHRSRVCTPSPRRRWILKPASLGERTRIHCQNYSQTTSATKAERPCNGNNVPQTLLHAELNTLEQASSTDPTTTDRTQRTEETAQNASETYENLSQLTLDTIVDDSEANRTPRECNAKCGDARSGGKVKEIVDCLERVSTSSSKTTADTVASQGVSENDVNGNNVGRFFGWKADLFNAIRKNSVCNASMKMRGRFDKKTEVNNKNTTSQRRGRRSLSIASSSSFCVAKSFNRTMSAALRRLSSVGSSKTNVKKRPSLRETQSRASWQSSANESGIVASSGTMRLNLHKSTSVILGTKQLERCRGQSSKPKRRISDRTSERWKPTVPYKPERLRSKPMRSQHETSGSQGKLGNNVQQNHQYNRKTRGGISLGTASTAGSSSAKRLSSTNRKVAHYQNGACSKAQDMWACCVDDDYDGITADHLERHRQSNALYGNLDSLQFNSDMDGTHLYYDLEVDGRRTPIDERNESFRTSMPLETFGRQKDSACNNNVKERTTIQSFKKPPSIPPKPGKTVYTA